MKLLLFSLLSLLLHLSSSQYMGYVFSTQCFITEDDVKIKSTYNLRSGKALFKLLFKNEPTKISSGSRATVSGDQLDNNIIVNNYIIERGYIGNSRQAQSNEINLLVTSLNICGYKSLDPVASLETIKNFNNSFTDCLNSTMTIRQIKTLSIDIPCISKDYNYNSYNCSDIEMYGWAKYTEDFLYKNYSNQLSIYKNRVFLIPEGLNCTRSAMANIGCDNFCYTWIYNSSFITPQVLMHEIGHNLGLVRTLSLYDIVGDNSCAMGIHIDDINNKKIKCYSPPQLYLAGVVTDMQEIKSLPPNNCYNYTISNNSISFLKITVPNNYIFIGMNTYNGSSISIYSFISGQSILLKKINNGEFYRINLIKINIMAYIYNIKNTQYADIKLCNFTNAPTACN